MTEQSLSRGQDILSEIRDLRNAMTILNKDNFFKIESSGCGMGAHADPFLARLHINLKLSAVTAINERIESLEKEFAAL